MPGWSVQSYGNEPTVLNWRVTVAFWVRRMWGGLPLTAEKMTLCASAPNMKLTVPVRAMSVWKGEKVLPGIVTVAESGKVPLPVTVIVVFALTDPDDATIVAVPARRPVTRPWVLTDATVLGCALQVMLAVIALPNWSRGVAV